MLLSVICYGLGCLSFLILIALMLLRRPPKGIGLGILAVCALTAMWSLAAALQPWLSSGIVHALDGVRNAAWLELLALVLINAARVENAQAGPVYTIVVPLIGLLTVANDLRFVNSATGPTDFAASQVFCRIVISVCGLLLVENLFRNTLAARRWHVFPLCIAIGGLFVYDLFVFSGAVITHGMDPVLQAGRGIVLALIVPPLIVTMSRNPSWNIDIHVSRRIVFHTATLTGGGIFLIVAAGVAGFVGQAPGDWGELFRLTFFGGSVVALAMLLSVSSLRSRLWRTLSENFFSSRYDYRAEWMRCIATLSSSIDKDPLQARVIRALADVVDSSGGALWLREPDGYYRVATTLNITVAANVPEPEDGKFIAKFDDGNVVQVFDSDGRSGGVPDWVRDQAQIWLAVPLRLSDEIIGFVVLASPRAPFTLSWESFDLLLTIGRQGASWLSEELAARALADSRALFEYSKKFSFVAHDVKNVSSQLGIMIANMKKFGDQPEFRVDMVTTMEASIDRLNRLLGRLKPENVLPAATEAPNLVEIIDGVIHDLNCKSVSFEKQGDAPPCPSISEHDLQSVLTHIITNSIEASGPDAPVTVKLSSDDLQTIITVQDRGPGMDKDFVRSQLFVPLRTTKTGGHGIGAFQARELVRAAGGILDITSAPYQGTCVRISLPHERRPRAGSRALP